MFSFKLYWIANYPLAIGPCPTPYAWDEVLQALQAEQVNLVVSFQDELEAKQIGIADEAQRLASVGIEFWRYPIADHRTPPFTSDTFNFIDAIAQKLDEGQRAYLHCFAGIGRSATIAAAVLIRRGASAKQALRALAQARGFPVPETSAQYEWVYDYETYRQNKS
ncbi:MAG: hypothetical protein CUN55_03990 [Phototrophicales bacterium]|nr:MAG: hypothetical protein CUN55_03990 [Phototrophicales bacterium]